MAINIKDNEQNEFSEIQDDLIGVLQYMGLSIEISKTVFFGLKTETEQQVFLDWATENIEVLRALPQEETAQRAIDCLAAVIVMSRNN